MKARAREMQYPDCIWPHRPGRLCGCRLASGNETGQLHFPLYPNAVNFLTRAEWSFFKSEMFVDGQDLTFPFLFVREQTCLLPVALPSQACDSLT